MAPVEIVSFPINSMVIVHSFLWQFTRPGIWMSFFKRTSTEDDHERLPEGVVVSSAGFYRALINGKFTIHMAWKMVRLRTFMYWILKFHEDLPLIWFFRISWVLHGAGIFTYKTGWFCSGKCWYPAPWSIWGMIKGNGNGWVWTLMIPSGMVWVKVG
jgi:hypothetical protein